MDGLTTDGFKALNEKDGREAAPRDLVGYVALVVFDADGFQLLS